MRLADSLTSHLWAWIVVAIALGLLVPGVARLEALAPVLLALMVLPIALTLEVGPAWRAARRRPALLVVGHLALPVVAFLLGRALGLPAPYLAGVVLLAASTPDLTVPLLTRLAGGDVHAAMHGLLVTGAVALVAAPLAARVFVDPALRVSVAPIVWTLLGGVAAPFLAGLAARVGLRRVVARGDAVYPAVSALAAVLITLLVAALNRELLLREFAAVPLARLFVVVLVLLVAGGALGLFALRGAGLGARRAGLFLLGTREYALAAALVVAAGFPAAAAVPALLHGGVQMTLAPVVARSLARS